MVPRIYSAHDAPTPPLSRSETPSAYEFPSAPALGLHQKSRLAGPPPIPWLCRLGPASDTRSRSIATSLDWPALPAIHRSAPATYRSSTSTIVWSS